VSGFRPVDIGIYQIPHVIFFLTPETIAITEKEPEQLMDIKSKIMHPAQLADRLRGLRSAGKRVVFTNGCFDILHIGHIRYLSAAKSEGDLLVVGLNSDQSVRLIKGKRRPIVRQDQRSEILAMSLFLMKPTR
jgi:cytidyltransferase-like protein